MVSPCPDIRRGSENSVQNQSFDDALIVTDADFSSVEDCDAFSSYFFGHADVAKDISEVSVVFSQLDDIVSKLWMPEKEQGLSPVFQAILNWLEKMGMDVDTRALQEFLPSTESMRLFLELSASLILLLAVAFVIRGLFSAGYLKFPKMFKDQVTRLATDDELPVPIESVDGMTLRDQLGVLLQRSINMLRQYKIIPVSTCYTNNELIRHMGVNNSNAAQLLMKQVSLVEPIIYGTQIATAEALVESQKIYHDISHLSHK